MIDVGTAKITAHRKTIDVAKMRDEEEIEGMNGRIETNMRRKVATGPDQEIETRNEVHLQPIPILKILA